MRIVCAISVDGKLASIEGYSSFSSRQDRERLFKLREEADAVIVGANTILNDNPLLTSRGKRNPIRVVIDGQLKIPLNARVVTDKSALTIVATTAKAEQSKIARLREKGVEVWILGDARVDLKKLISKLAARYECKVIQVEGGGRTNWEFLKEGLIDELQLTIAPIILGGERAPTLVDGEGFKGLEDCIRLELKSIETLRSSSEVILSFRVMKGR
ncbi:MAG TPA: 2,5-diamino-6-(ribosylamino)-4(3H)-pyrimidinone 5'-phosphate reductase [Candidatus Methanomethylia archaeon]|nr:2,5-diamino-6-(ribosylamino)-4(3H)-pyrimidinone 5'-phosphate reductase [Candidatus Methanomethylicia archaeon]